MHSKAVTVLHPYAWTDGLRCPDAQNWSYGSEVPLTGGRVLFFPSWREQQKYTNTNRVFFSFYFVALVWFFFSPRDLLVPVWEEKGFGEKGHYCDTGKKNLCMHTNVLYTGSSKAQNSFTTFNDLALYDQKMCFFFYCIYSGLLCCAHFPQIIVLHCLL